MANRPPIPLHDGEIDLERREVRRGGVVSALTPREAELVAYLAARPGVVVPQDELMRRVWHGERDSRAAYHVARRLRAKIEQDPTKPRHLLAVAGAGLRFEPARDSGPALRPGAQVVAAIALPDVERGYERDPAPTEAAAEALDALVGSSLTDGAVPLTAGDGIAAVAFAELADALAAAERWVAGTDGRAGAAVSLGDPVPSGIVGYRGPAVRRAVGLARAAAAGQVLLAAEVARALPGPVRPLGLRRIAGLRDAEPVFVVGQAPAGRALPMPATPFFGRARDLQQIQARFAAGARVVTLCGPGGIGKTRTALEAAAVRLERGESVHFCDLRPARTVGDVIAEVAAATGAPADAGIGATLAERGDLWLVLDDIEGAVEVLAPLVDGWLRRAPGLRVLATGREPLDVAGEQLLRIGPMAGPDGAALFEARARAVRADARLDPSAVEALVERLEGWPLALELCASRMGEASVEGLLAELGARGRASARRRRGTTVTSMDEVLSSSVDPLPAAARAVLAQASVFRGGFDRDAAKAVLRVDGPEDAALDALETLCRRSLVGVTEDDGGLRYRLLETVRAFAAELDVTPEWASATAAGERHAAYYVALGETRRNEAADGKALAISWFGRERENLVEVHARCRRSDPAIAARALLALEPWWSSRGPVELSLPQLDDAVAAAEASENATLVVAARRTRGYGRLETGDRAGAREDLDAALALAATLGDDRLLGRVWSVVSHLRFSEDDLDGADVAAQQAVEAALRANDQRFAAMIEANRGVLAARRGHYADAERFLRSALAVDRAIGSARDEAMALANLGHLLVVTERDDEAAEVLRDGIALALRTGNPWYAPSGWLALGELALARGDTAASRDAFAEALSLVTSMEGRSLEPSVRADLALLHLVEGQPDDALAELDRAEQLADGAPPTVTAWLAGLRAAAVGPAADRVFAESLATFSRLGADPWLGAALAVLREAVHGRVPPPRAPPEHALVRIARRIATRRPLLAPRR